MKLIIGLGNPGKEYQNTRHNAGFIILEELKKIWEFPEFTFNKKFNAEISEKNLETSGTKSPIGALVPEKIILARPQTFMNLSGQSVKLIMDFYKLSPEDIIVIHDDLDINFGEYKISTDSSAGGHNGVISIIENLGTQKFKRIRIGIEGSEKKSSRIMSGSDFVLQRFSQEELDIIKNLATEISRII